MFFVDEVPVFHVSATGSVRNRLVSGLLRLAVLSVRVSASIGYGS